MPHSHCAQVKRGKPSDLRLLVDVRAAHDEQLDHLEAVVPAGVVQCAVAVVVRVVDGLPDLVRVLDVLLAGQLPDQSVDVAFPA